jgi:hypothetical protein
VKASKRKYMSKRRANEKKNITINAGTVTVVDRDEFEQK